MKVLDQQTTWTSCCDVLDSLVSSHGTVLFDSLQFSIDDFDWPSVQESMLRSTREKKQKMDDEFDWTIFELDILDLNEINPQKADAKLFESADCGDDCIFKETNPLHFSEPSDDTLSVRTAAVDINDDWEVVNYDIEGYDNAKLSTLASNAGNANL